MVLTVDSPSLTTGRTWLEDNHIWYSEAADFSRDASPHKALHAGSFSPVSKKVRLSNSSWRHKGVRYVSRTEKKKKRVPGLESFCPKLPHERTWKTNSFWRQSRFHRTTASRGVGVFVGDTDTRVLFRDSVLSIAPIILFSHKLLVSFFFLN